MYMETKTLMKLLILLQNIEETKQEDKKKTNFKESDMFFMQFGFKDDKRIKMLSDRWNV